MKGFPTSYKDQLYNDLDAATEKRLGIPAGSVSALRLFGEKSNADQVSSAGARTPYQFTPTTRKLILNKYGVDPYLSPETASEAAGLLMKESLDRNKGNIEQAIGEYHGGTNRKAWGSVNSAYRKRVMAGMNSRSLPQDPESTEANDDDFLAGIDWDADPSSPQPQTRFSPKSTGGAPSPAPEPSAHPSADDDLLADIDSWTAAPASDVKQSGLAPDADTRGMFERGKDALVESVTGDQRKVESTEALPDWTDMPEMQFGGKESVLEKIKNIPALGMTAFTGGEETAKILKNVYPDMQISQDTKGNYLFTSPTDGKKYAYKPGLRASDLPRAAAQTIAYTAGAPETIAGRAALSALVQGAIETGEAAAGGDFDANQVLLAGAAVPAIELPMKAVSGALKAATRVAAGAGKTVDDVIPAVAPDTVAGRIAATDEAGVVIPQAVDEAVAAVPMPSDVDFARLAAKAKSGGVGSADAKAQLADIAQHNPEIAESAQRLGIDLPSDLLSDSRQIAETVAAGRGIQASPESVAWNQNRVRINDQLEETLRAMDANPDLSMVSQKVKDNLDSSMTNARNEARKIYKEVDAAAPKSTVADVAETRAALQKTIDEMGGVGKLNASEKRLWDMVNDPTTTQAAMNREREEIGAAIGGRQSAYVPQGQSRSDTAALKRIYGAMAQDKYTTIKNAGGEELADRLLIANKYNTTAAKIEKRIIDGFGREGEGSVVSRLKNAIKSGSGGDISAMNKLLKVLPPENRKEVLTSGLLSLASKNGHFSVGQFESVYRGLRQNSQVYAKFIEHLSPAEQVFLRDMYLVSKRVNAAENLISKTGKANQPLIKALSDGNLIQRLAESNGGKLAAKATSPFTLGAVSPNAIVEKIAGTPNDRLLAVTKFLNSDDFAKLASKESGSAAEKAAINKAAASKSFSDLARKIGVGRDFSERQKFISGMLQAVAQEYEAEK